MLSGTYAMANALEVVRLVAHEYLFLADAIDKSTVRREISRDASSGTAAAAAAKMFKSCEGLQLVPGRTLTWTMRP